MAAQIRRKARIDEDMVQRRAEAVERLGDYGLSPSDRIRFQRMPGESYVEGVPSHVNRDGSIAAYAGEQWRSFPPKNVERRERGPRGGTVWVPVMQDA